uniref:Keratin, high-sulfur matrix protein, B2A n=1 Tax=Lygus hesperus TaxID=30085 RepID=A0A0A9X685_LYGHE
MRMKFPSSFWIQILYIAISLQRIVFVKGAARYEDEFQRRNFYTNEQGVGVEVERSNPNKDTEKRVYEGRVAEEKIDKNGRSEGNVQPDYPAHNGGDNMAEIKSSQQNRKQIKRFTQRDRATRVKEDQSGGENHFRIPRERVQFIDGLDYQDRVDDDKNFVILSREETRGLRQARKSYSDPANTNWKWGFKRKQVKPEHVMKDAAVYGSAHNAYKHKEAAYARNQQSDVMAKSGHSNGDMDNENYSGGRQNFIQGNAKLAEPKNVMRDDIHQQACQRQEAAEEHFHRGVAQQRSDIIRQDPATSQDVRPNTLNRPVANTMTNAQGNPQEMLNPKMNNGHRPECARRAYNWDAGNPRIYSAPKFDNRRINPSPNAGPRIDNMRMDKAEKVENSPRMEVSQLDGQRAPNVQMELNRMDNGQQIEEQRIDNAPRLEEERHEEVPRVDHLRTNDVRPRLQEQGVEPVPQVDGRFDNSNVMVNPSPCCQQHENVRNEVAHGMDKQRLDGSQRIDSVQRIDNPPAGDTGWRDDGLQKIANAQKLKQPPGNSNYANNLAVPPKNIVQRLENKPASAGLRGGMREEEIRYLVFTPAEFSPMTLRTVLGESEKPISQEIPYCTLEEYKMESASLRSKQQQYENFQDGQIQYRGKGYNNEITRRKRKNREAWKKFLIRQTRIAPKGNGNHVQMPVHCCTATICKPKCPYGLVVQTEPYDPQARFTTQCYIDALTRSTCSSDIGIDARITPSKMFEELRGHRPIISHFDNAVYTTCVPPCVIPPCPTKSKVRAHQRPCFPLFKWKRTPDLTMLSNIINDLVKSNATHPSITHSKRESPEQIEEEKIIEKYLTSLMEQQSNNHSKAHYERNSFQGGVWLGKLLEELAENRLRSRMRMNQPPI